MKKVLLALFLIALITIPSVFYFLTRKDSLLTPLAKKITEKPLEKYSFENLRKTKFKGSKITIGKKIKEGESFESYVFYFNVQEGSKVKKVSGLMNLPKKEGAYPILVMFRGYVDREKYTIGEGTRHSGEVFAQNGFVTLAPDFLGYGESDPPSLNSIEERFQTYTTALTLFASLKNLNSALEAKKCQISNIKYPIPNKNIGNLKFEIGNYWIFPILKQAFASEIQGSNCLKNTIAADSNRIGIWGHSNGGHISLSVLAISEKDYPTVLWAPVSKPFPYSVLYFTDEFDDHGKALRKAIAGFEKDYDVEKYSPTNYLSWINAPIQIHQGTEDEAVPLRWSNQLNEKFKELEKEASYYTYIGDDHNFAKGGWATAIQRSIQFYKKHLYQ